MSTIVCRMCLNNNIRMYTTENNKLLEMYEKLINTKLSIEDGLPRTICYICCSQLQRFHQFSDMAHQSEKILRDQYNNGCGILTHNTLYPRPALNLEIVQNLTVTVAHSMFKEDKNQLIPTGNDQKNNYYVCMYEEAPVTVKVERFKEKVNSNIVKTENCTPIEIDDGLQNIEESLVNDSNETNSSNECDFSCDMCKKKFDTESHLQTHLRTHSAKKKPFTCKKCNKSFSMVHNLRKHLKNCTGEKKTYTCEVCGKIFYNVSYFKQHMNIHLGAKPFACKICGKTFSKSSTLYSHKKCHSGEKPYLCNTCGMTFGFKCSLNLHIRRVHTEVKPYACNICSLSFNYETGLAGHMQTHTAVRPYICDICNKGFTSTRNLKAHMAVHSGERPHNCNRCGKAFKRLEDLRKHMKTTRCQASQAQSFDLNSIMRMGTSSTMINHQ